MWAGGPLAAFWSVDNTDLVLFELNIISCLVMTRSTALPIEQVKTLRHDTLLLNSPKTLKNPPWTILALLITCQRYIKFGRQFYEVSPLTSFIH